MNWESVPLFLFISGSLGAGLVLFLYPLLMALLSRFIASPPVPQSLERWPGVSLVVVLRNAAAMVREKIVDSLALDYPAGQLEVLFFSDGSTDETLSILREHPEIRALGDDRHLGKIHGMNTAVAQAAGEILVFSDADGRIEPQALKNLLRHFSDPRVGGVCGQRVIARDRAAMGEGQQGYIRFDSLIKRWESALGYLSSNDGKLYAIRKGLYQPLPEAVTDDLYVAMSVIGQGYRFHFEPEARVAIHVPSRNPGHELVRRRRIVSTSLRGIRLQAHLLNPLRFGLYALSLFINKVLRRLLPVFLLALLAGILLLAPHSLPFAVLAGFSALFLLLAAAYPLLRGRGIVGKVTAIAFYFTLGNLGTLLGVMDFLRGRIIDKWEPVKAGHGQA